MTADGGSGAAGSGDASIGTHEGDDDEALSWGSSSDQSYVEGPLGPGTASDDDPDFDDDDDELPDGVLSSTSLVAHGVFAAILLLYTVAWIKSVGNVVPSFDSAVADWMWRIGTYLAVAGPALWFIGTVLLLPTGRTRSRLLSFVVAVVVLLPWPFVIGVLG